MPTLYRAQGVERTNDLRVSPLTGFGETAGAPLAAHDGVDKVGRLYVEESRFDDVVYGVSEIAKSIVVGGGFDADTQMGPLVSDEQLRRVTGYLDSGQRQRLRRRPPLRWLQAVRMGP